MKKFGVLILAATLLLVVSGLVMAVEGSFNVTIKVPGLIDVEAPGDIVLDIEDPDKEYRASSPYKVSANTSFNIIIESRGFGSDEINNIVTYNLAGANLLPVGDRYVENNVPAGIYNGKFEVLVKPLAELGDWTSVVAAEYTDVITFTISAN